MIQNYLLIALRNLRRDAGYSAINIGGLAVALACCILILLHVDGELQFDKFNPNWERTYRVNYVQGSARGVGTYSNIMPPVAGTMEQEFPQVESAAHFVIGWRLTLRREASTTTGIIARRYFFSNPEVLQVFNFPLLEGDPRTALQKPNSVVLTEEKARQLFGNDNPLGEQLFIDAEDFPEFGEMPFEVTGVMKHIPANSHLQFDFLLSEATLLRFEDWARLMNDWDAYMAPTYVVLKDRSLESAVVAGMPSFVDKFLPHEEGYTKALVLQPLSDVHFGSEEISSEQNANEGDILYVRIFVLIALFIAGIACVNYVNLATARALTRAREIALRKVVGAERWQVALQFMFEAYLHTLIAFLVALGLVETVVPWFNELANSDVSLRAAASPALVGLFLLLGFVVGLVAGLYPSLVLSGTKISLILKGEKFSGPSGSRLRNVLVTFQFVVTIVMIVASVVVYRQLQYTQDRNVGFERDHRVAIDINSDDVQEHWMEVKNELLRNSSVKGVTVSSRVPGDWKGFRGIRVRPDEERGEDAVQMRFNGVDTDFISSYGMVLTEGRNFDRSLASDSAALILNETAASKLFGGSPLNKRLRINTGDPVGHVIGVVRDFNYSSLHDRIEPLVLGLLSPAGRTTFSYGADYFTVHIAGTDIPGTIEFIKSVHARFDHVNPMEIGFLDEWWNNLYEKDRRLGSIFGISAALAVIVACVGLLGLSAFIAEQRTKELGVRKVLGASTGSLVRLLSARFLSLVIVGFMIAVPVSYVAMNTWLDGFAYRISIGWVSFAFAGALACLIAFLTVASRALKAARANPATALKYE